MTIRMKLLLFIPLLVLLVNSVTYFLFESGKIVQTSYDRTIVRVLLYKQSVKTAEDHLKTLYGYLLNPNDGGAGELGRSREQLLAARASLVDTTASTPMASAAAGYVHMLDTLMEQEQAALAAATTPALRPALDRYEEAEQTTGFIREEGQHLVDMELSLYQPVYKQIQQETGRINRLGAAILIVNTVMSVVIAIWISRSITRPVSRLVAMARQVSTGNLRLEPPPRSGDELGILLGAFTQMSSDLNVLIEKDKESLERDRFVKELELQALQSQINPHFLFNTLNVLSKLALLEGAEKTSDLIVSMSNLLRYNLRKLDRPVTLREELEHVKEYITIQQARFRDRVKFETDIDDSALDVPIPLLTLQPIVENSFLHGIADMEQGAVIRLEAARRADEVRITLSDNGIGMSEQERLALLRLEEAEAGAEKKPQAGTGLGTRNVFKRLQLFYGSGDLVDIESGPGEGTKVTIRIPAGKGGGTIHVQSDDRR
ncbi:sensor histidine kinase [Paenibacillus beijingensis]|uniref:histidine kinase n=1 Tax=Paenibacillus beijingensis TaxID=1126833 RepID=A0A0D5NG48_9BACL|nr:sensor histidine kinase [Paenibacillus beijingensis]AJY74226.1 membrane protein [Paenibacillus beijingensis]